ncbi:MAG: urease accessory protein UreD [Betaproteobacteria bacterium]|nr:urease accessory protein UreD [Betaproteobacteria bacterium]
MDLAEPLSSTWRARLSLGFQRREAATILARREHVGPLRIQKALYPEGEAVCHAIVLHPPSGIVGGDELEIDVTVGPGAHALLTTPGAGKWYRSAGAWASQRLGFAVEAQGVLEWLPQETIVFDAARAAMRSTVDLADDARFIGMEVLCLGRRASGEKFTEGALRLDTRIRRAGRPVWLERGLLEGGSDLLDAAAGLAGFSVSGTFLAAASGVEPGLLAACRDIPIHETGARHGITALPEILVARYLGHSSEAARQWFVALWQVLRPALIGREAQLPRIWNT